MNALACPGTIPPRYCAEAAQLLTVCSCGGVIPALNAGEAQLYAMLAPFHDIGKRAIPSEIRNKHGRLTREEFEVMKTHTTRGRELLEQIPPLSQSEAFPLACDVCRHHHERWDGSGYPDHLAGHDIAPWVQVVGLADAFDALLQPRVYKAITSAAKGAAVGGPYGAAAGLALAAGQHGKKLLAAVAVVLLLPVLFVLMLPGLIFGGLTSSGTPGKPILNDGNAITENMDSIAAAIDEILAEGVADAQARAAQDFASTGGDNYEIIQPFTVSSNTNSFIGQYCAAKEENWAEISLEDLKRLLRAGKAIYTLSPAPARRGQWSGRPDTPDVVETKTETWYIYTLVYNGEAYFADQVFHLTDDQKELAGDYAQNLSLFLSDGSIQYTEYSGGTIAALGDVRFTDGATEVVYFNQLDQRYANQPYGTDNIGGYGCGPTSMAIVVSSLTGEIVDPTAMAKWAYENGGWCKGQGSYHSLIPNAAKAWGLNVEGCKANEPQRIFDALSSGKLVVAIMSPGHFTTGGHFIVLRGVKDGKILVANPASTSRSQKAWDLSIILNEAGHRAGAGGPFWLIG